MPHSGWQTRDNKIHKIAIENPNNQPMIYIAFLRGINVGGKNIIKMNELKQVLEKMKLKYVQTYIQSGNVLFESEEPEMSLQEKIEK